MNESTELKGPILCEHCGSPIDATTPVRVNAGTAGKPWNLLPGWFHQRCGVAARAAYLAAEDDLGDTPEHLRPLLAEARKRVPGTVVTEVRDLGCIWHPDKLWRGWAGGIDRVVDWNNHGGSWSRSDLKLAIQQDRAWPTADARRIGREEFGMVFAGDPGTLRAMVATMAPIKGRVPDVDAAEHSCPPCACGATTNLRTVVIERTGRVTVWTNRCGTCEQERRRTELLAEMDRKLPPKEPEKSLAPASWPEEAGDNYEL
jgi:hypothetical protein